MICIVVFGVRQGCVVRQASVLRAVPVHFMSFSSCPVSFSSVRFDT